MLSESTEKRIEAQLTEIRRLLEKSVRLQRAMYPLPEAAELLGVGMTKMRELVKSGVVMTVPLAGRDMVPNSEIERLSYAEPPKMIEPKQRRLAASLAKLRHPESVAPGAALRMRNAKRPRPAQDLEALEAMLKADVKKRKR